jgi:hypothetical protein
MKVSKQPGGSLELELSGEELEWLRQTLNECCNGFLIEDYNATIGTDDTVLRYLLDQIGDIYDAPIGHEG